jgi:hypothetical protein
MILFGSEQVPEAPLLYFERPRTPGVLKIPTARIRKALPVRGAPWNEPEY